jgi:serine phosphatase RsbU (regulator of sigma subunit)
MVRAGADSGPSLAALVTRINRHLCDWLPSHSFVTMVAVAVDPVTGAMECVNAGHPPALLVDSDGDSRTLQAAANPALGVAAFQVEVQRTLLEPGAVLLMYTDGITELRDPHRDMLGQERLGAGFSRLCMRIRGAGSAQLAEALRRMLEDFRGDRLPEDDRAYLIAQRGAKIG